MKWVRILSGVLLVLAILQWPYDYYIFLRWVICCSALFTAYRYYQAKLTGWVWVFGAIAFLFNPITPLTLTRAIWVPIDFMSAILFFVAGFQNKKTKKL